MVEYDASISTAVEDIDAFVGEWFEDRATPGLSIVLTDADDICYESGFGVRNRETEASATPATLYGVASLPLSKTWFH